MLKAALLTTPKIEELGQPERKLLELLREQNAAATAISPHGLSG